MALHGGNVLAFMVKHALINCFFTSAILNLNKIMSTQEQSLKIDLHVHTPASKDYVGCRSAKGYSELVKAFVQERVDVIAITDHNTINGYIEYVRQVADTKEAFRLMLARDENSQAVKDLKNEIEQYERLQVIPGVEITVYPNIHVILIFSDSVVDQVTDFLKNDLSLGEAVDAGDPKKCSKESVISMLDLAQARFEGNFFCILPHVETSKGAWEELAGEARAELFRDQRVVAAQFSSPATVEHISKVLANGAYKRKTPLGFIQCSDYHGDPNVKPASQFTVLKKSKLISFEELKSSLADSKCVRCSHEFVEERMAKFLKSRHQVTFEFTNRFEMDEGRKNDLAKALCGILNSENAVIRINLFNVTDSNAYGAEPISKLIRDLQNELDPNDGFDFVIAQFHQSASRQRYLISIDENTKIRLLGGICWVVDGPTPQPAKAWRVEQIVARAHFHRVGKSKQKTLESASTQLIRVSNSFPAMAIWARIGPMLSRARSTKFGITFHAPDYPSELEEDLGYPNGLSEGDFIQLRPDINVQGGRLNDQRSYYRFSAPVFCYSGRKAVEAKLVGPNCAILFPGGGINYVLNALPIYGTTPVCVASVESESNLNSKETSQFMLGFTAWMKSSFVLWYVSSIYQTNDIFQVLMQKRPFPLTNDDQFIQSLSVYAQNIIMAENATLRASAHMGSNKEERLRISEQIRKHNESSIANLRLIDKEIFRHLAFDEDEIREVYRALRKLDLYDYEIGASIDDFVKEVSQQ